MNGKELLDFGIQNRNITTKVSRYENLNLISYLHLGVDWNDARYRYIRGVVVDDDGNFVQRGYKKFFNHNELNDREDMNESTKVLSTWQNGVRFYVTEKIDGSIIKVSMYKEELIITSSGSFDGEHVMAVREYLSKKMNKSPEVQRQFFNDITRNHTLIFEYINPKFNLIIPYDSENLIIHGVIETKSGIELSRFDTEIIAKQLGFNIVEKIEFQGDTLDELKSLQVYTKDFEGWVVTFENGVKLKFKTDWFFESSEIDDIFFGRANTKRNVRYIYDLYLNGELDDFITLCTSRGKKDLIDFSVEILEVAKMFDIYTKSIKRNIEPYKIDRVKVIKDYPNKFFQKLAFLIMDDRDLSELKEKYVFRKIKEIDYV